VNISIEIEKNINIHITHRKGPTHPNLRFCKLVEPKSWMRRRLDQTLRFIK